MKTKLVARLFLTVLLVSLLLYMFKRLLELAAVLMTVDPAASVAVLVAIAVVIAVLMVMMVSVGVWVVLAGLWRGVEK